jgi:hypothetical protein
MRPRPQGRELHACTLEIFNFNRQWHVPRNKVELVMKDVSQLVTEVNDFGFREGGTEGYLVQMREKTRYGTRDFSTREKINVVMAVMHPRDVRLETVEELPFISLCKERPHAAP